MIFNINKSDRARNAIVGAFISVPILSSLISTIHLVGMFDLGNFTWMSVLLSIAFELGSIASFLVPAILPNIKKEMVYTIFAMLAALQIIGNVYFSYDFMFDKVLMNANWLDSFIAFINNFGTFTKNETMLYLSSIIGIPIPLISLFFLKSWMDYLKEPSLLNNDVPILSKTISNVDEQKESIEKEKIPNIESKPKESEIVQVHENNDTPIFQNNML